MDVVIILKLIIVIIAITKMLVIQRSQQVKHDHVKMIWLEVISSIPASLRLSSLSLLSGLVP